MHASHAWKHYQWLPQAIVAVVVDGTTSSHHTCPSERTGCIQPSQAAHDAAFTVATHTTAANCEGDWKCKPRPWLASNPYTTTTLTCRAHHLQSWCPTHASTHAIMHTPPTTMPLLTPLSAPNELLTSIDVLSSIQLSCNIPLHAYLTNLNPQPQMQKQAQPANILIPSSLTIKTKLIISPPPLPICLGFEFHPWTESKWAPHKSFTDVINGPSILTVPIKTVTSFEREPNVQFSFAEV